MDSHNLSSFSQTREDGGLPILLSSSDDSSILTPTLLNEGDRSGATTPRNDNSTWSSTADTMKEVHVSVPTHPIPSMQGAFAESMLEASTGVDSHCTEEQGWECSGEEKGAARSGYL